MNDVIKMQEWLQAFGQGFSLAGVSDGEVFISTEGVEFYLSPEAALQERVLIQGFRQAFPDAGKLTFIVKPSIAMLQAMVEELNELIDQAPPAPAKNLLDIGDFDG
jgi:hypothetical protein